MGKLLVFLGSCGMMFAAIGAVVGVLLLDAGAASGLSAATEASDIIMKSFKVLLVSFGVFILGVRGC